MTVGFGIWRYISMVLESNWNEDYDFSAMAKSQRGSGGERKGWPIVNLICVFLNYGSMYLT